MGGGGGGGAGAGGRATLGMPGMPTGMPLSVSLEMVSGPLGGKLTGTGTHTEIFFIGPPSLDMGTAALKLVIVFAYAVQKVSLSPGLAPSGRVISTLTMRVPSGSGMPGADIVHHKSTQETRPRSQRKLCV